MFIKVSISIFLENVNFICFVLKQRNRDFEIMDLSGSDWIFVCQQATTQYLLI